MKKYMLTKTTKIWRGITLYQIKALVSFGNVSKDDLGGKCRKGHLYTPETTLLNNRGHRYCLICKFNKENKNVS